MVLIAVGGFEHQTNTFSPIATPSSAFGHGNGPNYGEDARAALTGSNIPSAAFLDIARRQGADVTNADLSVSASAGSRG